MSGGVAHRLVRNETQRIKATDKLSFTPFNPRANSYAVQFKSVNDKVTFHLVPYR